MSGILIAEYNQGGVEVNAVVRGGILGLGDSGAVEDGHAGFGGDGGLGAGIQSEKKKKRHQRELEFKRKEGRKKVESEIHCTN